MMQLKDKKISVIGMARTGIATANFLRENGARVTITDEKSSAGLTEQSAQLEPGIEIRFESSKPAPDAELVVLSPGVDIHSPALADARLQGTEIISELELAYRCGETPIIAVTGTNGKTTTTSLIGAILKRGGLDVQVGGNIGTPFVSLVTSPPRDFMVLEVSSFQLEGAVSFHPRMSLILNLTPDHLDRHKTMEHYAALKEKIAAHQVASDWLIYNRDDPWVSRIAQDKKPDLLQFSIEQEVIQGAFLRAGQIVLRREGPDRFISPVADLAPGLQLQVENVLAAVIAADLAGVDAAVIAASLKSFAPLAHRLEWVRSINGVEFINDSKGTNVGAVQKSLNSFNQPVILIMGGQDKGADFSVLKELLKKKVKHMILLGEARQKIQALLNGSFGYEEASTMEAAVRQAWQHAEPGDVVLLSPACASFDMFRDYMDRGEQFKATVNRL